jgi:predicted nucleotidyltransferase
VAEIPDIAINKIRNFLHLLKENNINVERTYLFGSYANGTYNEWSDIDLALISNDFSGNIYQDKIDLISYIYIAGKDISPIPYRSEDFENSIFAREEILKKGVLITQ